MDIKVYHEEIELEQRLEQKLGYMKTNYNE